MPECDSAMWTLGPLPNETEDAGRTYTKSLGAAVMFRVFLQFLGIVGYYYWSLPQWAGQAAKALTSNFYLQVALCWIPVWIIYTACSLPASWHRLHLDRKFGLSQASFMVTLLDFFKAKVLVFFFGFAVLEIMFASHRISPTFGWVWAGILCSLLYLLVDRFGPWLLALFSPVFPLSDISLRDRLTRLTNKAGIRLGAIFEWHISGRTRQANALVSGIGVARRILLTDTLISKFSQVEMEAIVAHELGHCALHHIRKRVLLRSVILCGIFWVINSAVVSGSVWLENERLGWADLNLIPGILVIYVFGYFYGNFIMTALSRSQERAADLYSWKLMGRTDTFITAMRKLHDLNLIVIEKSSQWTHSHPSTAERIAAAERYAKEHFEATAVAQVTEARSVADPLA